MGEFLIAIVPLFLLLFREFFSSQAKAKEEGRVFQLTQTELKRLTDQAVEKWNSKNIEDSKKAANAWDESDRN